MAPTHDLLLVYSQDVEAWSDYVTHYLARPLYKLDIATTLDHELVRVIEGRCAPSPPPLARTYIVILSPGHIQLLLDCSSFSYADIVSCLDNLYTPFKDKFAIIRI